MAPTVPHRARKPAPTALKGAVLGVAMGMSNALGYLVVMLLSRPLGPAEFGGYTALSTYGVLLAIPAGVFQVVVARRLSRRAGDADGSGAGSDALQTTGLAPAAVLGVAFFAVTAAISAPLAEAFHLHSALSAVLLGAMLVPMMVTGCFQGILLGRHRLRALSALYLITAVTRVVAAAAAAIDHLDVTEVFAAMFLAAAATAVAGAWLCRHDIRLVPPNAPGVAAEMLRSNSTLAAYVALTNIDVLFARHFLSPHESGGYALASTFGRAICWGTQFVALLIVPRMHGADAARTLLRASALVLGIGLVGFGIVAIDPQWWITVAGGSDYREFGHLALLFVVLGMAWAVAQIWLFSEMGANRGILGALTWAVIVAEAAAIAVWLHHNAAQIVGTCLTGALLIALTGLVRVVARHRTRLAMPEESVIVVADRP
ncbi:lipopolysaccharide biosynthesis protein [Rudaeicoccus suwonensis]|uniref:O-antigen/teichoic acid export membrane protein n=1 Tax=Rudaeicoccus suwonensis TaxID=657409 RepID=A0A561EAL3_9MICO|nr:oligosaccharide flippase family protein [Rudaeicoccus suwonensis]TWE12627.1 O-antigen/teichoic acid export membrane protein [Rudaeicoccus suwonensis]